MDLEDASLGRKGDVEVAFRDRFRIEVVFHFADLDRTVVLQIPGFGAGPHFQIGVQRDALFDLIRRFIEVEGSNADVMLVVLDVFRLDDADFDRDRGAFGRAEGGWQVPG